MPANRALVAFALAVLLAACGGSGDLAVEQARSRMSPRMADVGSVYLEITNDTGEDDRLVAATVDPDLAARAEIHETFETDAGSHDGSGDEMGEGMDDGMGEGMGEEMDDGTDADGFAMMGMREIEALEVPAGATVSLEPGGHHIMLLELVDELEVGEEFELTLEFEGAGTRTVTVEVREDV